MQIGILFQDGFVYQVFDSGDYAADQCKAMQKKYPWYKWSYMYTTLLITPKVEGARS